MLESFIHARDGIAHLLRTQRNFRVHAGIALLAVAVAAVLRFSGLEWAILILTIALVLAAEGLNTGIEIAVTLASPERRPEAKAAKDIAAGVVLLCAVAGDSSQATVEVGLSRSLDMPKVCAYVCPATGSSFERATVATDQEFGREGSTHATPAAHAWRIGHKIDRITKKGAQRNA